MDQRKDKPKPKRAYAKPRVRSQRVFEQTALECYGFPWSGWYGEGCSTKYGLS